MRRQLALHAGKKHICVSTSRLAMPFLLPGLHPDASECASHQLAWLQRPSTLPWPAQQPQCDAGPCVTITSELLPCTGEAQRASLDSMAPMHLRGNTRQHVHQGEGGALPIEINAQVILPHPSLHVLASSMRAQSSSLHTWPPSKNAWRLR